MLLLRQALAREPGRLHARVQNVPELYAHVVDYAVELGLVGETMRDRLIAELLRREADNPTAIGGGVAVPHAYLEELNHPAILFVRLQRPLHMGALDGTATRYVFLLIGPSRGAVDHMNSLAAIARTMSDDPFRYALERAETPADLAEAFDNFTHRQQPQAAAPDEGLQRTGKLFGGVWRDIRRRLPSYASDFRDGLHSKTLSSIGFMLFACLAPAVTFGGVMAQETGGMIGAAEMLAATAMCGVVYSLVSGQPLVILGGTGPMLVLTAILYQNCARWGLPFLPVYGWVGLWSALFLVLLAATDTSALMRWFTRFTDEIFAALISLIFIYESLSALASVFTDPSVPHDSALLTLVLALGTFYLGYTLGRFRGTRFLWGRMRDLLSDFGPTIALALHTLFALQLDEISLQTLATPERFGTTSGRSWLLELGAVPWHIRLGAAVPALLVAVLVFLDQNITARIINSPGNRLRKGAGYHLDLLVVGVLVGVCSMLGLPWLVAATVRSLNHVHSLATERGSQTVHVRETRLSALTVHLLIGLSLFALPLLKLVPMAVLYGLFLMMGVNSMRGNQFLDRIKLWITDPDRYPPHHYIGRVPMRRIRRFTSIQASCLVVLWAVKVSVVGMLFPLFIAALVPLRLWIARWFTHDELAQLDGEDVPNE